MFWNSKVSNKFGLNLETVFSYMSFIEMYMHNDTQRNDNQHDELSCLYSVKFETIWFIGIHIQLVDK